eukprot:TRINITY_DN5482_c0_g1_i1.p2 TRINITY_DN5482_c0_g1~~TRINITY_DN5482_c0_g1_i1.p2  ORF type:complete len:169 (-),score=30.57 TRINITY_DN5482_c0_g1_i1:26-532(-)
MDACKWHPNFYRAHEGLARLYQAQHKLVTAEQEAKRAVELQTDEGTLEVLADIYQHEGDMPHAHKYWRQVLKINSRDKAARYYLGLDSHMGEGHHKILGGHVPSVQAVSHTDFVVILSLALGGCAVVAGVVAYSVHASGGQQKGGKKWMDEEEGVGLMNRAMGEEYDL